MPRPFLPLAACLPLCPCVRAQHDFQLSRPDVQYLYTNQNFVSKTYQSAT